MRWLRLLCFALASCSSSATDAPVVDWSAIDGHVAFLAEDRSSVVVLDATTRSFQRVGLTIMSSYALSPDATRIAYSASYGDSQHTILVRDIARGSITPVSGRGEFAYFPAWSRDGAELYYSSEGALLATPDGRPGGLALPFQSSERVDSDPGRGRFALVAQDGVRLVDRAGADLGLAKPPPPSLGRYAIRSPAWSPDGSSVAFIASLGLLEGAAQPYFDIYRFAPEHPDAVTLVIHRVIDEIRDASLAWSPDGTRLMFDADNYLWTIRADGSGLRHVVGGAAQPAWSR